MLQLLAVVALVVAAASAGTLPRLPSKIVGGDEVPIEMVPHQVSIQYDGNHHCGGSIISENWVLTAAHCFYEPKDAFTIHAGSAHSQNASSVHRLSEIISHRGFAVDEKAFNDIALIRVEEPFIFDKTRQPVTLYAQDEEVLAGSIATVSGWGATGDGSYPEILNLVQVPMISKNQCAELYSSHGPFLEGQICALYDKGGKDACSGDSGGPLTVDGRLAGIVSWGEGCARPTKPGVYTEVAYFHDWIKTNSDV